MPPPPLWAGDRIRPPFPCVSYEATKMVYRWRRVYSVGLRRLPVLPLQSRSQRPGCCPKMLPLFSNYSRTQFTLNLFYKWCNMLLTGLHHSSVVIIPFLLPSNSSILPLHLPSLLPPLTGTTVRGNHYPE